MTDEAAQEKAPERNPVPAFLIAMLFYLCVVYANTLYIYPMGRDYVSMAAPNPIGCHEQIPGTCSQVSHDYSMGYTHFFSQWKMPWTFLETRLFNDWLPGYHLVNLTLLYGCMVALFFLTRHIVRGPWWMGSLAAVLFMANPVKSEAVLNLRGVQDLLPAFLALISLALYAAHVRKPRKIKYIISMVLFVAGMCGAPSQVALILAYFLIEVVIAECAERCLWRLVPFILIFLFIFVSEYTCFENSVERNFWNLMGMFLPLCLILYPIGFLPETLERFQNQYWLILVCCMVIVVMFFALAYASRHRGFVFGILAAMCLRFLQGSNPFDVVHMIGGGQLLLPVAFMSIAFAALVHRVIQHPKWLRPMIFLTAALCVVFFGLQFQMNMIWRYAGQQVQAFQQEVYSAKEQHPEGSLGVLPSYRYYRGAPMNFQESIKYKTPFSKNLMYDLALVEVSRHEKEWYEVAITTNSEKSVEVEIVPVGNHTWKQRVVNYEAGYELFFPRKYKQEENMPYSLGNSTMNRTDGSEHFVFSEECLPLPPLVPFQLARPWIDW